MKRLASILTILFTFLPLFASTSLGTAEVEINVTKSAVCTVSLNPLEVAGNVGMPFDITDSTVEYNASGNGRNIATWNLASSVTNITLSFTASVLTNTTDSTTLDYYLTLFYSYLGADDSGNDVTNSGSIKIYTGTSSTLTSYVGGTASITLPLSTETNSSSVGYPIVISENNIYFMFGEDADTAAASGGDYTATLSVTMEAN